MPVKKTRKTRKKKELILFDVDKFRSKLKLRHLKEKKRFSKKHKAALKILEEKGIDLGKVREHSVKAISAGALTGALLLSQPVSNSLPPPSEIVEKAKHEGTKEVKSTKEMFLKALHQVLPERPRPLTYSEEKLISIFIKDYIGIDAKANLEGEHLNTSYGYIGAEQHLKRYPGDTLSQHGEGVVLAEGIAPGLGAWGYFAPSKNALSVDLEETERWYAVVQTMYLPDWNARQPYLRDWYKYRKVLIINTNNGNAVVAAIADSGPAAWTGKHFGGSPEVMLHLGGAKYKKGPVILFFVDDPENKVPLGPVEYNKTNIPEIALEQA